MKQTKAGIVFASLTGSILLTIVEVNGQRFFSSLQKNCEQYRDDRGQYEITGNDDSVYCLHQHLYQSALTSSPNNASIVYVHELLKKALARCIQKVQKEPKITVSIKKKCRTRQCKKLRYAGRRGKRYASRRGKRYAGRRGKRYARKHESSSKRKNKDGPKECAWERKEVRMMPRSEWNQFTNRINILKRPITIPGGASFIPYDVISDIHSDPINLEAAHNGPNFPGWHRVLLLLFETAIGVPIPYWDYRFDYDMEEPVDSVLWSDEFFGPGIGTVDSGPFANWITAGNMSLFRNIGLSGSLISECMVERMLRYKSHDPIVKPTVRSTAMEDIHEGPHDWVGGQFSVLETAPHDPIFFLHHSFVDYMWYLFRENIRKNGKINPSSDYPNKGPKSHGRNESMIPFTILQNIHGYGDLIEGLTRYERSPTCPSCGKSDYLECDTQVNRCKSTRKLKATANIQNRRRLAMDTIIPGTKFVSPETDPRTRGVALSFLQLGNTTLNSGI